MRKEKILQQKKISEIFTKTVEETKKIFTDQPEGLKAQLLFLNQHNLNWKAAERDALIDYNKKISAWVYSIIRFPLSGYDLENYKELKKQEIELDKRQYECDIAEAHVNLFENTDEFNQLILNINLAVIELEGLLKSAMIEVHHLCTMYELQITNKQPNEVVELYENLISNLSSLFKKFHKNRNEQYKEVVKFHTEITKKIRDKLLKINTEF